MKEIYIEGYDTIARFPDDTPDQDIQKALESNFPETDDQFVNRIADPETPASAVSFEDFKKYQKLKPDLSWGELGGLVIDGAQMVAGELFSGVKSTLNLAAQGQLGKMGASLAEGAARGTYDLGILGRRIHDNLSGMLEPYIQETGDAEKDQYNRFLAIKEMDNVRNAARKGDSTVLQRFGIGVDPSMVDTQTAEAASYFLDPTVLGTGGSGRLATLLTKAGAKPSELASRATGAAARGIRAAESKVAGLAKRGMEWVDNTTGGLGKYAIPGGVGAAAYAAGIGPVSGAALGVVGAVPALEIASGLFRGFSNSMMNTPTRIGAFRHLAQTQPATIAGKMAGNLKWLDTPIEYAGKAATGAVIGAGYGAGLGALAGGLEGAAQGIGAGSVLGAGTTGTMRLVDGLSGRAKYNAELNDYTNWSLKQDSDTQNFLKNQVKTHRDRIQIMDAIQLAQAGIGDQGTIRILSGKEFDARFPGADGVQLIEGDTPVAYVNGKTGNSRVLMHELFHTVARLDGFDGLVANISNEIGRMYSPDEVNALIREYESSGKMLQESEGLVTTGDKFAALAEEIGAEYFANYIKGKDSSYLLKGTPFKDALNAITSKFVAGKLDRVYSSFQSEIFGNSHLKQSLALDRAMNDLVKARRKAYRDVELSADDAIRAYGEKDLGDDQIFKELQALGVAELDNKGRRVMRTSYKINQEGKELGNAIATALKDVDSTGGMIRGSDGSFTGRNFSPAQIEALNKIPGLSDKVKEVIRFISKIRNSGSDAANVTYAAATYKTKKGKTRYKNLPISNRDALIYGLKISPVGTVIANILDLSLLRSKIVRQWGNDARLQKVFGTEDAMFQDALTYINALGGDVPTATVLGSQDKRNLLGKLLGARNVRGNPEIPEGLFLKEGDHPWRSFRLDRFVKARPLEKIKATFSDKAYINAQANFSPSPKSGTTSDAPWQRLGNASITQSPGLIRFSPAYHGTPHKFEKFKTEKIGTGEGAQAYGWGLYFAENIKVAEDYRKKLSDYGSTGEYEWKGNIYQGDDFKSPVRHAIAHVYHNGKRSAKKLANEMLKDAKKGEPYTVEQGGVPYYEAFKKTVDDIQSQNEIKFHQGTLYEVDLKVDDDSLLIWDKPLSSQSEFVKAALTKSGILKDYKSNLSDYESPMNTRGGGKKGEFLYNYLSWKTSEKDASLKLLSLGIKGIKYKDQGSRSKSRGTHNYVIFDENDVSITKVNNREVRFSPRAKPTQADQAYLKAVQSGDMEAAQKMVDEAAASKGFLGPWWHGGTLKQSSDKIPRIPSEGFFLARNKETAESYGRRGTTDAYYFKQDNVFDPTNENHLSGDWLNEWIDFWREEDGWVDRIYGDEMSNDDVKNIIQNTELYNYEGNGSGERWKDFLATVREHYDGYRSYDPTDSSWIAVVFNPEHIKSADPITYDDQGNVIPLSERFNTESRDIRFSPRKDRIAKKYSQALDNAANNPRPLPKDLKEAWEIGRSVANITDIHERVSQTPDWVFNFGNDVTQFYEAGIRGEEPQYVVGYRRGPIPESGRSKNYASNDAEPGVSLAYAHNVEGMETNPHTMAGVGSRGVTLVSGWTFPKSLWGSDGELVALAAQEIPKNPPVRFSPKRTLNNRGGAIYESPSGHRAIQPNSRSGVRVWDTNGKRVGPVFQSVEKAEQWILKRVIDE